jgi:hypothetical protein
VPPNTRQMNPRKLPSMCNDANVPAADHLQCLTTAAWQAELNPMVANPSQIVLAKRTRPAPCSPFPEAAAAAEGGVAIAAVGAAPVVEGTGLALPHLEGALRFVAHDDHKIGILASLNAKALV